MHEAGDAAGLQLHLKKHARDAGHTPTVKEMLRSPLPPIPPFKGAKLPEDSETTIPAVRSLCKRARRLQARCAGALLLQLDCVVP